MIQILKRFFIDRYTILKCERIMFYEKFGAKYIEKLANGEKLYYIDL